MTGVAEMFAEYSGEEVDWFQMQFWFEQEYERQKANKRDNERRRYRVFVRQMRDAINARRRPQQRDRYQAKKADPDFVASKRKTTREAQARYRAKRMSDPAWIEKQRKAERESQKRRYWARKEAA